MDGHEVRCWVVAHHPGCDPLKQILLVGASRDAASGLERAGPHPMDRFNARCCEASSPWLALLPVCFDEMVGLYRLASTVARDG